MTGSNVAKGAAIALILSLAPMAAAGAMETVGGSVSGGAVNDNRTATVAQASAGYRLRTRGGRDAQVNRNAHASVKTDRNVPANGRRPGLAASGPAHPEPVPVAKPPAAVSGWARPGWYRWTPGGAIAAGAAIGFVTAADATWATPPRPGLCWYYTDPSRQDGFWDDCP